MDGEIQCSIAAQTLVRKRGTAYGAAPPFELLALVRVAAHSRMQAESVRIGAQTMRGLLVPADHRAQA